jgi:CheY-like chemotaxis protein
MRYLTWGDHATDACRRHLMKPLGIAIAEDDWFLAEYLCGELAALGHALVGRARTGEELITLVARERPDLVLADVRLADESDGLAAAKEVQERFDIPSSPSPEILPLPRPKQRDSWES